MGVATAMVGAGIVLLIMSDVLRTTLGISGGGRLTRWVAQRWWSSAGRSGRVRVRRVSGPAILLLTLLLWVGLLWIGWTLVFGAAPEAIIRRDSNGPADVFDRLYFTGYTLFTLGIGDLVPRRGAWQIVTIFATVNGFFVATLAVAYVIPTLAAVVDKRRLAGWISALGETPQQILMGAWDGTAFKSLEAHLTALVPAIELHTQRHRAYPVVHYFHGAERRTSIGPSIAALDEAAAILLYAAPPDSRPAASTLVSVRRSIAGLLDTLAGGFVSVGAEAPPLPDLTGFRAAGLPLRPSNGMSELFVAERDRRALLLAYVLEGGNRWFEDADGEPPPRL